MVRRALPYLAHLVAILHSQLRSMRPCACTHGMHHSYLSTGPFVNAPPLHTTGPKDRSATDHALLSPNNHCKVYHRPQ